MTTIAQIITDAYQLNNLVALSVIPNAEEQDKGLRYLNRIIDGVFGNELGDKLTDVLLSDTGFTVPYVFQDSASTFDLPENTRIINSATVSQTVYLPENPQPGARIAFVDLSGVLETEPLTLDGNGRNIEGSSTLVLSVSGVPTEWFYRDDLANWQKLSTLALEDDFPFPSSFEELFISLLALRLTSSEDTEINTQTAMILKEGMKKFKARYRQTTEAQPEAALLRTPWRMSKLQRYINA